MEQVFWYSCLVSFITLTVTRQRITLKVRELFQKYEMLYYLVNCPFCFSFWVCLGILPYFDRVLEVFIIANCIMSCIKDPNEWIS